MTLGWMKFLTTNAPSQPEYVPKDAADRAEWQAQILETLRADLTWAIATFGPEAVRHALGPLVCPHGASAEES